VTAEQATRRATASPAKLRARGQGQGRPQASQRGRATKEWARRQHQRRSQPRSAREKFDKRSLVGCSGVLTTLPFSGDLTSWRCCKRVLKWLQATLPGTEEKAHACLERVVIIVSVLPFNLSSCSNIKLSPKFLGYRFCSEACRLRLWRSALWLPSSACELSLLHTTQM
jgi:hypothetical protein